MNTLNNGILLKADNKGPYGSTNCALHAPAKPGEHIGVENLFTCWGKSLGGGGTTSEGIVKRSYLISFEFNLDKRNCIHHYNAAGGEMKNCEIISSTCNWGYIN